MGRAHGMPRRVCLTRTSAGRHKRSECTHTCTWADSRTHRGRSTSTHVHALSLAARGRLAAQYGLGLGPCSPTGFSLRHRAAGGCGMTHGRMDKQLAQGKHWPGHGLVWALKPGQQEAGAWLQGMGLTWGRGRQGLQWGQGSAVYIRRKGTRGREEGWACGWERQLLAVWLLARCGEGRPQRLGPNP